MTKAYAKIIDKQAIIIKRYLTNGQDDSVQF